MCHVYMTDNSYEWETFMTDINHARKFFIKLTMTKLLWIIRHAKMTYKNHHDFFLTLE